jgi:FMN phosphatase YigB (HAD superfamily)
VKELEAKLLQEPALVRDYESGSITSTAFLKGMSALCATDLPEADFIRVYAGIYTPNPGIVGLIQKIKAQHKVGLVAQAGPWRFAHAIATSECFSLFDSVTLSYEVGTLMPDPRLFEDALTKLDLMAEECVYIDAKPSFAQAATEHLLHGIAYVTPVALMTELRRHKVVF